MWPYSWTHVGTPSHLGHMDRVAATMPSQAHAGAAQEAPNIGQWEGQDVPLVRPSSCTVKGGIPSSRRYLPTYLHGASCPTALRRHSNDPKVLKTSKKSSARNGMISKQLNSIIQNQERPNEPCICLNPPCLQTSPLHVSKIQGQWKTRQNQCIAIGGHRDLNPQTQEKERPIHSHHCRVHTSAERINQRLQFEDFANLSRALWL